MHALTKFDAGTPKRNDARISKGMLHTLLNECIMHAFIKICSALLHYISLRSGFEI